MAVSRARHGERREGFFFGLRPTRGAGCGAQGDALLTVHPCPVQSPAYVEQCTNPMDLQTILTKLNSLAVSELAESRRAGRRPVVPHLAAHVLRALAFLH